MIGLTWPWRCSLLESCASVISKHAPKTPPGTNHLDNPDTYLNTPRGRSDREGKRRTQAHLEQFLKGPCVLWERRASDADCIH